jgi:hypothetical protein
MRLLILGLMLMAGCASTKPLSMKPIDAEIPELRFSYLKDGAFKIARGHAADHFVVGDPKVLKIRVHSRGGKCLLRYIDGDTDKSKDCTGLSEVTLDLGKHYERQPEVIGVSVSQEKLGIQQGFFYPSLREARSALTVEYKCPYSNSVQDLDVCTRPASYSFKLKALILSNTSGEIFEKLVCNEGTGFERTKPVYGSSEHLIEFTPKQPTFCVLGIGLKQGKKPDGSYEIIQSKSIFIRFYNPKYIPLPAPSIEAVEGGFKACGSETYDAFSINDRDFKKLDSGKCVSLPREFEFMAWDSLGRFTWDTKPPLGIALSSVDGEGWQFYENSRNWIMRNMTRCSNSRCVRSEINRLMNHPKMVQAVESWDSSILYEE